MPIIVTRDGKTAEKVGESGVPDEAYLQGFVANNPDSLPIEDIKENVRLLVVGREFETASGPIDVLAVDEDGDLYVIETKLYKNPDKRRVIAQMLDYGAALWRQYTDPATFIGQLDAFVAKRQNQSFASAASEFLEDEVVDFEAYAESIKKCLEAGGFRFVVLMDKLDERLKDLILFMNARTEFNIYAVEMEFYRHEGLEIVIPKLFGAEAKKSLGSKAQGQRLWDKPLFLEDLEQRQGKQLAEVAQNIIEWVEKKPWVVRWGSGKETGTFRPLLITGKARIRLFYLTSRGRYYFGPGALVDKAGLDQARVFEGLRDRLNRLPGIDLGHDDIGKWTPELDLKTLEKAKDLAVFQETIEWLVEEIRSNENAAPA